MSEHQSNVKPTSDSDGREDNNANVKQPPSTAAESNQFLAAQLNTTSDDGSKSNDVELGCDGGGLVAESAADPAAQPPPPSVITDSCYSWFVVVVSFANCFIVGATGTSFAILYFDITEYFVATKAAVGWIGSLYMAVGNILCIVVSVFLGRFGCRVVCIVGGLIIFAGFAMSALAPNVGTLCFTYGILAGMGGNMIMLTSLVIVQHHFAKFRAAAAAISASGMSVGALSSGPMIHAILDAYQWRGTLLLLAAIGLHSCVFGAFYRPPQPLISHRRRIKASATAGSKPLSATLLQLVRDLTDLSLFKNPAFSLCCAGSFCMCIGLLTFFAHSISRALFLGVPRTEAFLLPTANGVAMLVGGLVGGLVGNLRCTNRLLEAALCITVSGLFVVAFGGTLTFLPMAVLGVSIGFLVGCFSTVQPTVMSDIVGVQNIAKAQAFILLSVGISSLIGVPLAGYIFDATHDYNLPFFVSGVIHFFGGVLYVVAAILRSPLCLTQAVK